jgi:hypothetical protein
VIAALAPPPGATGCGWGLRGLLSLTRVSRDELIWTAQAPGPSVMAALLELALIVHAELPPSGIVTAGPG